MNAFILGMALAFASQDTLDLQLVIETKPGDKVSLNWNGTQAISSSTTAFHRFFPLQVPRKVPLKFKIEVNGQGSEFKLSPLSSETTELIAYDSRLPGPVLHQILRTNFQQSPANLIAVFYESKWNDTLRPNVALLLNPICENCTSTIVPTAGVLDRISRLNNLIGSGGAAFQVYELFDRYYILSPNYEGFVKASTFLKKEKTTGTSTTVRAAIAMFPGLSQEDLDESSEFIRSVSQTEVIPQFVIASNQSESRAMYQYQRFPKTQVAILANSLGAFSEWIPTRGESHERRANLIHYITLSFNDDEISHEVRSLHGGEIDVAGLNKTSFGNRMPVRQKGIYLILLSTLLMLGVYIGYRIIFGASADRTPS